MKKSFIVIGGIIILLVVGILIFLNPFREVEVNAPENIVLDYNYKEGTHSFSGEVDLPNSCYSLVINSSVRENYPEQISLFFSTEKTRTFCTNKAKTESFSFALSASSDAVIKTFFNQEPISFDLNIK